MHCIEDFSDILIVTLRFLDVKNILIEQKGF